VSEPPLQLRPREIRNAAALAFVGFLIGIAVQEMVTPVRAAIQHSGISVDSAALGLVFLLTALTAFVLGQFNIMVTAYKGSVWLMNFLIFVAEAVILIFMGGVATVALSTKNLYGFFDYLGAFYVVDLVWTALTIAVSGAKRPDALSALKRYGIPQIIPMVVLVVIAVVADDPYGRTPLVIFTCVVAVDFLATMVIAAREFSEDPEVQTPRTPPG
jgi:hypothetical protein